MTFKPMPKPVRTCKDCSEPPVINGRCVKCAMRKRNARKKFLAEKKKEKNQDRNKADEVFYAEIYLEALKEGNWFCGECGTGQKLPVCHDEDGKVDTFSARWYLHHVCAKSPHPSLRHVKANIFILCRKHHAEADNIITYPKMKTYPYMESIKKELLTDKEDELYTEGQ